MNRKHSSLSTYWGVFMAGVDQALTRGKALWFPMTIFLQEMVVRWYCFDADPNRGFLFPFLFSFALGFLFSFFCALWGEKGNRVWSLILAGLVTFWLAVQTVYYTIFNTFMTVYSISGAGQVLQFWREALDGIRQAAVPLLLLLLPWVLLLLFGRRYTPKARAGRKALLLLAALAAFFQFSGALSVLADDSGVISPRYLYKEDFVPQLSVSEFGVITTLRLDVNQLVFGLDVPDVRPTPTPAPTPTSPPEANTTPDVTPDPTPTPRVYGPQVMDIDFAALSETETDKTLKKMHNYFATVEPTMENEYTGLFAGKNLIWLTAEGFSRFAVSETYTPTLYKLANSGFVFTDFYNPLWWVSTSDGEYVATTSLIPKGGVWSMYKSGSNSMPFCMGNQLRAIGYTTKAYHNHTYSYYHREVSHPNMGYDYKGVGNGLDVKKVWPESDVEMMEVTVPEYIGSAPFHTYYMTVSGHMNYTFIGNTQASKHRSEVADLDMSEGPRAYIACQMELDRALENLLAQLEEAGQLENTVICLSADHYPYGMEQFQLDELNGGPLDMRFDVYRSTLILWSGDMEEPIVIDKPCSSLDILPTLSNLFDVEYDSRLMMGRDILSDAPALVMLSDRSFITDLGRYDSKSNQFTPNEGVEVPDGYAKSVIQVVNDKFAYSKLILEQDYYGKLGLTVKTTGTLAPKTTPKPTATAKPTPTPAPTAEPSPEAAPRPTAAPPVAQSTPTPSSSPAAEPAAEPPVPTPEPTAEPVAAPTPEPTPLPPPEPSPAPTPEPTPDPSYEEGPLLPTG